MADNWVPAGTPVDNPFADSSGGKPAPPATSGEWKLSGHPVDDPFREPSGSDVAGSGIVSGASTLLGAPVDIMHMLPGVMNPVTWQMIAKFGEMTGAMSPETAKGVRDTGQKIADATSVGGSKWWEEKAGQVGLPTVENTTPSDPGMKFLQHGIKGATAFLAPGVAGKVATAAKLPVVGEMLSAMAPGNPVMTGALGAASGVGGEAAAESFGEAARPYGEMAGAIVPAAVVAGAGAGAHAAWNRVPPLREKTQKPAAEEAAVQTFETAMTNPQASVAQRLAEDNAELVKGSRPTTPELLEDPGLLALQRTRERLSPDESIMGEAARERRAANTEARSELLQSMAPAAASPASAQALLRRHLEQIDAEHQRRIEQMQQRGAEQTRAAEQRAAAQAGAAEQQAAVAREALIPGMTPEEQGQAARTAVEAERAPVSAALQEQRAGAQQATEEALESFGGKEAMGTPEERAQAPGQYGATMRDPLLEGYLAERQRLSRVRQAIDPSGEMGMRTDPIKEAVKEVEGNFHPDTFGGMESKFYRRVDEWGPLVPIEDAFRLRADINARLKNVPDHNPQEERRLQILKNGIDAATDQAVNDASVLERAGALNQGAPALDERFANLEKQDAITPGEGNAAQPQRVTSVGEEGPAVPAQQDRGSVTLPEAEVPPANGGVGPQGGGPGGGAGGEAAPQRNLRPLTPEAREQFAQWNREYGEMMRAYEGETAGKLHAVGKILQKGGAYDSMRIADSEVPWVFINGGKTSREAVDRFLAVAPESARAGLDDAYAFSLRSAAQRENGTLDLKAYQKWLQQHQDGLSARPELLERFNSAAEAQKRLNEIDASILQHEKDHPLDPGWGMSGVLGQFWKAGATGGEMMRRYKEITGNRPEALRAAEDYAAFNFLSTPGVLKNGAIDPKAAARWIMRHQTALRELPEFAQRVADATLKQGKLEDLTKSQSQAAKDLVQSLAQASKEAMAQHLEDRKTFTGSVAGAFIGDDPERAIGRVFSGNDRAQKAQILWDLVKGNGDAREGLQRAAIDYIKQQFQTTTIVGTEERAFQPQQLQNFVSQNKPVLDILFPGTSKNFEALAADLRREQLSTAAKMPGGSDTFELTSHARSGEKPKSSVGQILAYLGVEKALEHITHHWLAGQIGAIATVGASRVLENAATTTRRLTNEMLDRMLLDPAFAHELRTKVAARQNAPEAAGIGPFAQRTMQSMILAARGALMDTSGTLRLRPLRPGSEITAAREAGSAARGIGHNGGPPMDVTWTNPLPVPEGAAERMGRKAVRGEGVGSVVNKEAIELPNGIHVGPVNLDQWIHRVETVLGKEGAEQAGNWYKEALPVYVHYFGPEKGPQMLGAWLIANQNVNPAGAQLNAVRALEQFVSKATPDKQAGLAADKLAPYWEAMLTGDQSKLGDITTGQKIYDFLDSAGQSPTRTFYGNDPRAGGPAVADIHSLRDTGRVDPAMHNWIAKTFGDEVAAKVKKDRNTQGLPETSYEWSADRMRNWAKELNEREWLGRNDWKPSEVQAIGWMTMSKMMGRAGQTAEEAITSNIKNLSYELDFGSGAPFNQMFPEWHGLSTADKGRISNTVLADIVDFAKSVTGAHEYGRTQGTGGWLGGTNPSVRSHLIATEEAAKDMANVIGYLAQQTEVSASRRISSGDKLGLLIAGKGLDNDAIVRQLWSTVAEKHPDLAPGFSPTRDLQGNPGIELIFNGGGDTLLRRIEKELAPTLDAETTRLGLETEGIPFKAQKFNVANNWEKHPDGRLYIEGLSKRYGPDIQERLDVFRRESLEPKLRQEIDRAAADARAGRVGGRTASLEEAQRIAEKAAATAPRLEGLPDKPIKIGDDYYVPGPVAIAHDTARRYMEAAGLPYDPPTKYAKVDKERASRIATAFDEMKHAPNDPAVKASYEAMAAETLAQWEAIKKTGLKVEWIKPGQKDPYAETPRLAIVDMINNNHLWAFPTDLGYGSGAAELRRNNPMVRPTGEVIDGRPALVNDIFRIVHDYFGHFKDGVGFRAEGEENAWRSHSAMYSDAARPAMTAETRGQNSWVNYGPHGDKNRTASSDDTVYAPQKIGLLPDWVVEDGRRRNGGAAYANGGTVVDNHAALHREARKADHAPSDAQKEAGNYRKGHVVVQGIPITIENAKGSFRRGVHNGKPWSVRMPTAYGYVKQTEGMDGEHVDVYVGHDLKSQKVWLIDQVHADTKEADEHKAMLGFPNRGVALHAYKKAFSDGRGKDRLGSVTEMSVDQFKSWLKTGRTKKPLGFADGGNVDDSHRLLSPDDQSAHLFDMAMNIRSTLEQQQTPTS